MSSNSVPPIALVMASFDINSDAAVVSLTSVLDTTSGQLARSKQRREELGLDPSLWSDLQKLWKGLVRTQLTFWDDSEGDEADVQQPRLKNLCLSVARFTRNLVAGVPHNQEQAFKNEPEIRRLLHYYTSWSAVEDKRTAPLVCMLAQALSNVVTSNENLMTILWEFYTTLPEDQIILLRLLSFPDHRVTLTVLVFILNCIKGSSRRTKLLCQTVIGSRICITILDSMIRLYDAEEQSDGGQAFDIGYQIFSLLIQQGHVPDLYTKFSMTDEPVTPHQTTLLKIVDSFLQSKERRHSTDRYEIHSRLGPLFANTFFSLSAYAQGAIDRSLRSSSTELDVRLPKACEALVLLTQCMVTVSLAAESKSSELSGQTNVKIFFNEQRRGKQGIVESLVESLRLLDLFLPRINFGKPVASGPLSAVKTYDETNDVTGFSYLKRDLVRLLGILCHKERKVQDRIRECGGIQIIMNMCVIDERNPYLKEHAILALRNILEDNGENQNVVESIKPVNESETQG
ncbi:hypothetical protein AX14_007502 [Amanita brunnescens Koide BX004]|nr:hypothetical protein AX14_007502 [Amanita brunnescens Koide BX004]